MKCSQSTVLIAASTSLTPNRQHKAIACESIAPPSELPTWQWLEENVELDNTSDMPGKISFELFPASKFFLNACDNPDTRRATCMKCGQSGITQNAIGYVQRRIKDRPTPTMWTMAAADHCEEFAKKRFFPAVENCPALASLVPKEREKFTKRLIQFASMNMMLRGANSRIGLQSDPVGLIVCDERREWKKGRIELIRRRTRTFAKFLEISIGAAGVKKDELHRDWESGSQTFPHFKCLSCGHSQPFRFGRDETVIFQERKCGGILWEENDATRDGSGQWNWEEFKKTVVLECENPKCKRHYRNTDKLALLETVHEHHRNPNALPEYYSLQISALMLPWISCDWSEIAKQFLIAKDALKVGDIEPLKEVITEDFGEPWELRSANQRDKEFLDRCGDYKMAGTIEDAPLWPDKTGDTTLVLTFDRQQFHLVYVIRQWRKNGESRLIKYGLTPSYDDLRALQLEWRIKNKCMWGDDGGTDTTNFRQACLRYGWQILKGEDFDHYTISDGEKKSHRQGWRQTEFDPGIGTVNQNRATITAYLWSNSWYKDKLYNLFLPGKGPLWEIPRGIPSDYLKELGANEWRERTRNDGSVEGYFHETGPDHFADCELEQIVVADIAGITRMLPRNVSLADSKSTTSEGRK